MVRPASDTQDADPLPDGTKSVRVLFKEIRARVPEDPNEDHWSHEWEGREDLSFEREPEVVVFEEGDELPLDLARTCWSAFNDRLAALDGNGKRRDQESTAERHGFDYGAKFSSR